MSTENNETNDNQTEKQTVRPQPPKVKPTLLMRSLNVEDLSDWVPFQEDSGRQKPPPPQPTMLIKGAEKEEPKNTID